jgi:hypothetical protein
MQQENCFNNLETAKAELTYWNNYSGIENG